GRDGRSVGIHLRDQRNERCRRADGAYCACCYVEKIAARVLRRSHGRHVVILSSSGWRTCRPRLDAENLLSPTAAGRTGRGQPAEGGTARRRVSIGTLAKVVQARYRPQTQSPQPAASFTGRPEKGMPTARCG